MAQITSLQPYGLPGRTRTFAAKAAAGGASIQIFMHHYKQMALAILMLIILLWS